MDIECGAVLLDVHTGKHLCITASFHRGDQQIGWLATTGRTLGRLTEKVVVRLPVDPARYRVIQPAPRRRKFGGSSAEMCRLQARAQSELAQLQPGQLVTVDGKSLGQYDSRWDGGYAFISEGTRIRYEAWELGEWLEDGALSVGDLACADM